MAANRKPATAKPVNTKPAPADAADDYFNRYNNIIQRPWVHLAFIPLLLFSLLGLLWAIPFPHIRFLGRYNGYLNWASFLIAFAIYYYMRVSAKLSYLLLLYLFLCSYGIIELLAWRVTGGPEMWMVCIIIFPVSVMACTLNIRTNSSAFYKFRLLLYAPVWEIQYLSGKLRH